MTSAALALEAQALPEARETAAGDLERRIIAAALACIARWGLAKTALEDVARQARCSRATVYRLFPGGKEALLLAVGRAEVARVGAAIVGRFEKATTLEDLLVHGLGEAAHQLRDHPVLSFLLAHEPEAVVPWLAFQRGEELLAFATALASPHLARFLAPEEAQRAAEWATRVLLSFGLCPAPGVDLSDEGSARSVVSTFLLPGLLPGRLPGLAPDR